MTMLRVHPAKADLEAWRKLASQAVEPNPFFEPELLLPAVRDLGHDGVRLLISTTVDGAWRGVLPVLRAGQWRRIPCSAHGTWIHPYAFFGAPLLAAGHETAAMAEMLGALRHHSSLVPLEGLPADGPVAAALGAALESTGVRAVVWNSWERAALRRREADDYVESMLSSKRRRELRRQLKLLTAELGAPIECVDASADPAAPEAFQRLEASGWKGRAGTAMDSAAGAAFFRDICESFRAAGRLQLLLLRGGERIVAAKCNFLAGDGVFCFKIAYDESLAAFSPGVQLELENVHVFHGRTALRWEDSCADPANTMINRLWPDRRRLTTLLVPGEGARGRVGRLQAAVAVRARNAQRRQLGSRSV